jgi:transcriptional regulator with XRE-family HTH domain
MKLATYLEREGLSPTEFARRCGKPPSTISRLLAGSRDPGLGLLRDIMAITNGEVMPNDFLEHEDTAEAPAEQGAAA